MWIRISPVADGFDLLREGGGNAMSGVNGSGSGFSSYTDNNANILIHINRTYMVRSTNNPLLSPVCSRQATLRFGYKTD